MHLSYLVVKAALRPSVTASEQCCEAWRRRWGMPLCRPQAVALHTGLQRLSVVMRGIRAARLPPDLCSLPSLRSLELRYDPRQVRCMWWILGACV